MGVHGKIRVKVCGITRAEDAAAAADFGADAIGVNFFPKSPRYVAPESAQGLIEGIAPFVSVVALFVNPSREDVQTVLSRVDIDVLQFHGTETPEFCESFSRPYIKAIGVGEDVDLEAQALRFRASRAVLLDALDTTRWGGTGETFDWSRVPERWGVPFVLAGGLDADNVAEAIQRVSPAAVDVCGGVEAEKGIKDLTKLENFMRSVHRVSMG
ncbi:MAG: phosphoribosylanthranilate isomerase [Gammaproteobacteria bacterium]|nr:phosphoribosylanthranilate isomerase [Gammaproteobacteria bacterium]